MSNSIKPKNTIHIEEEIFSKEENTIKTKFDNCNKKLNQKELLSIIEKMQKNIDELNNENSELKKNLKKLNLEVNTLRTNYPNRIKEINKDVTKHCCPKSTNKKKEIKNILNKLSNYQNSKEKKKNIMKTKRIINSAKSNSITKIKKADDKFKVPYKSLLSLSKNIKPKSKQGKIHKISKTTEKDRLNTKHIIQSNLEIKNSKDKIKIRSNNKSEIKEKIDNNIQEENKNKKEKYKNPLKFIEKINKINSSFPTITHQLKKNGNYENSINSNPFKEDEKDIYNYPKRFKKIRISKDKTEINEKKKKGVKNIKRLTTQ